MNYKVWKGYTFQVKIPKFTLIPSFEKEMRYLCLHDYYLLKWENVKDLEKRCVIILEFYT